MRTLGVRPNFSDYPRQEQELIRRTAKVYYPSSFYAELFDSIGKNTFPNCHTYKCAQDKIKQTALFNMAGIAHPRTHVFYGRRQKSTILDRFDLPFVAKKPRGSAMGRDVFLIRNKEELASYCQNNWPAYIQEYLPVKRDIRAVVIGGKVRHAYWRVAVGQDFRTNISAGGRIDLSPVPDEALSLALRAAQLCKWDDVGVDIIEYDGAFYILEGNMKYGRQGFRAAGIDYLELMTTLIRNGEI